jgi:hypothetical protein
MACAAIAVSAVSVATPASAAQAIPASAAGIPAGITYQAQVRLINAFNSLCLDGREGTGNVTLQTQCRSVNDCTQAASRLTEVEVPG